MTLSIIGLKNLIRDKGNCDIKLNLDTEKNNFVLKINPYILNHCNCGCKKPLVTSRSIKKDGLWYLIGHKKEVSRNDEEKER